MTLADLFDSIRRALFGARPTHAGPHGRRMGRAMIGDSKYDPLKAELKRRGFTDKEGALLKLKLYTEVQLRAKFPGLPRFADAIGIPYTNLDGQPNGHIRFRYLLGVGWRHLLQG
jgi:hypothetical protein